MVSAGTQPDRSSIASAPVMLAVEDLHVIYDTPLGQAKAVTGVSFTLRTGERLGLVGESGSGKTTMASALLRLLRPPGRIVSGQIRLNGRDLLGLNERELRALRLSEIALIPQAAMNSLNPVMRLRDQIEDAILAHQSRPTRQELRDRIDLALSRVGLTAAMADRFPHELSGGQKQRAAMAIAVTMEPKVIVADEPTSALDVVVQRQVMLTLGELQASLGAAVLLIGHDMGLIAQFADTIGVLYAGRLAEYGPIDQVLTAPRHPYTRLLIDSLPTLDEKRPLRGIPGLPPPLVQLPPGCSFRPRCPFAFERCVVETPPLSDVAPGQRAACLLYPDQAALPGAPAPAMTGGAR